MSTNSTQVSNRYATDGRCHNAEPGTFNHECGNPAVWIGDHCKNHGYEARVVVEWQRMKT